MTVVPSGSGSIVIWPMLRKSAIVNETSCTAPSIPARRYETRTGIKR